MFPAAVAVVPVTATRCPMFSEGVDEDAINMRPSESSAAAQIA